MQKVPTSQRSSGLKYYYTHKDELKTKQREYYETVDRASEYKKLYNITTEQYDGMLADQYWGCAGCGRSASSFKKRLAVDHNHRTGKVRGLLCPTCNLTVGRMDSGLVKKLQEYLRE